MAPSSGFGAMKMAKYLSLGDVDFAGKKKTDIQNDGIGSKWPQKNGKNFKNDTKNHSKARPSETFASEAAAFPSLLVPLERSDGVTRAKRVFYAIVYCPACPTTRWKAYTAYWNVC